MSYLETVLSIVITVSTLLQVAVLYLLYRTLREVGRRTDRLIHEVEPHIRDLGEGIRTVRRSIDESSAELKATIAAVRATTQELSGLVHHTVERAERQVEELDHSIDQARSRVSDLGERFDRVVLEPARVALAVGAGVRRAVETLLGSQAGRSKKSERDDGV